MSIHFFDSESQQVNYETLRIEQAIGHQLQSDGESLIMGQTGHSRQCFSRVNMYIIE
jgi:hypothetical protein